MNQERDQSRTHIAPTTPTHDDDLAPGRGSRSSRMDAPARPIAGGLIQRKARDANGVAEGADAAVASAASSAGSPLPAPIMRKFESSLGTDLSSVRIHTGAESAGAASAVGAKAYTTGQDIHFAAGNYDPTSSAGELLLAHEVAHTVQQSSGVHRMQTKLAVSAPGDSFEVEADRAAEIMVLGASAQVTGAGGLGRVIQRDRAAKVTTVPANELTPSNIAGGQSEVTAARAMVAAKAPPLEELFARAAAGGGTTLPYRDEMEERFGANFASVRAATGRRAELDAMGANAATRGEEVVFADAAPDQHTVAHELAHVLQSRHGVAGTPASRPGDGAEREAHDAAALVVGGGRARVVNFASGAILGDWKTNPYESDPSMLLPIRRDAAQETHKERLTWTNNVAEKDLEALGFKRAARGDKYGGGSIWQHPNGSVVHLSARTIPDVSGRGDGDEQSEAGPGSAEPPPVREAGKAADDAAALITKIGNECSELIELRKQGKGQTPEYEQKLQQLRNDKAAALREIDQNIAKIPNWESGVNEQAKEDLKRRTDRLKSLRDAVESLESQIADLAAKRQSTPEPDKDQNEDNSNDENDEGDNAGTSADDDKGGGSDPGSNDDAPPSDAP